MSIYFGKIDFKIKQINILFDMHFLHSEIKNNSTNSIYEKHKLTSNVLGKKDEF